MCSFRELIAALGAITLVNWALFAWAINTGLIAATCDCPKLERQTDVRSIFHQE